MTNFSLLFLLAGLWMATIVQADGPTYLTSQSAFTDFKAFLGLSGEEEAQTYFGTDSDGIKCQVNVKLTRGELRLEPSREGMTFQIPASSAGEIMGGFERNLLWSEYFENDEFQSGLSGQYGISLKLRLERSRFGELTRAQFSRTKVMDLAAGSLGYLDCGGLRFAK